MGVRRLLTPARRRSRERDYPPEPTDRLADDDVRQLAWYDDNPLNGTRGEIRLKAGKLQHQLADPGLIAGDVRDQDDQRDLRSNQDRFVVRWPGLLMDAVWQLQRLRPQLLGHVREHRRRQQQ